MAQVEIQAGPHRVVSLMSREAARRTGLAIGAVAVAVVKSTTVIVETPARTQDSICEESNPCGNDRVAALGLAAVALVALGRCGSSQQAVAYGTPSRHHHRARRVLAHRDVHPARQGVRGGAPRRTKVKFSFGGSSTLAQQITQGAPADVFAVRVARHHEAGRPTPATPTARPSTFVSNQLVIAVPPGNPKGIKTLADLTKPGLKVVAVRARGAVWRRRADRARRGQRQAHAGLASEPDVKSALTKVSSARPTPRWSTAPMPRARAARSTASSSRSRRRRSTSYPIVALKDSKNLADRARLRRLHRVRAGAG